MQNFKKTIPQKIILNFKPKMYKNNKLFRISYK